MIAPPVPAEANGDGGSPRLQQQPRPARPPRVVHVEADVWDLTVDDDVAMAAAAPAAASAAAAATGAGAGGGKAAREGGRGDGGGGLMMLEVDEGADHGT